MQFLNVLFDKIDEIRWDLTYKLENFVETLKYRCTKNPKTCKRINCSCPWVEEISIKPKKKKTKNFKKRINNRKKNIIDSMGMCD